jgi:hypothetical protein
MERKPPRYGFTKGDIVTFRHTVDGLKWFQHRGTIDHFRPGFWQGMQMPSLGAEIECEDGMLRFIYLHDLARDVEEISQNPTNPT